MFILAWLASLSAAQIIALVAAATLVVIAGYITGKKLKERILKRWREKHGDTTEALITGKVIKAAIKNANHDPNKLSDLDDDLDDDDLIAASYSSLDSDDDITDIERLHSKEGISDSLKSTFDKNNGVLIFEYDGAV